MSHLPIERLAALADEPPSQTEAVHLAACAECARERAMFRSLADLANGESARIGQPHVDRLIHRGHFKLRHFSQPRNVRGIIFTTLTCEHVKTPQLC